MLWSMAVPGRDGWRTSSRSAVGSVHGIERRSSRSDVSPSSPPSRPSSATATAARPSEPCTPPSGAAEPTPARLAAAAAVAGSTGGRLVVSPVQTVRLIGAPPDGVGGSSRMLLAATTPAAFAITGTGGVLPAGFGSATALAGFAPSSAGSRRTEVAAVAPTQRAVPVTGRNTSRSCRLKASITPTIVSATRRMKAPVS